MRLSNAEMSRMLEAVEKHLSRKDVVGYACARNARILRDELSEFIGIRNELVMKYGEKDVDDNGVPTGQVSLAVESENFAKFAEEIEQFALIEHEPELFKLNYSEAIGALSGEELLEIDWMFED